MKAPLVILHGANGSAAEMAPLVRAFEARFDVRVPNLLGHGGRRVPDRLTLEAMADDLTAWLDGQGIGPAFLLGYSLGAYLALHLARHRPERARAVIALSPKHVFDPGTVAHITYLADPARLSRPGNPRKAELEAIHGADAWVAVTNNSAALFRAFGERAPLADGDFAAISTPALLAFGDLDPIVPLAEAHRLARLLPNARLALFPGLAHPLRNVPIASLARAAIRFMGEVDEGSFAPGTIRIGEGVVRGGLAPGPSVKVGKDERIG